MQQRRILSEKQINAELLNGNLATPKWYFPVMGVLGIGVVIGFITILYMFNRGPVSYTHLTLPTTPYV